MVVCGKPDKTFFNQGLMELGLQASQVWCYTLHICLLIAVLSNRLESGNHSRIGKTIGVVCLLVMECRTQNNMSYNPPGPTQNYANYGFDWVIIAWHRTYVLSNRILLAKTARSWKHVIYWYLNARIFCAISYSLKLLTWHKSHRKTVPYQ